MSIKDHGFGLYRKTNGEHQYEEGTKELRKVNIKMWELNLLSKQHFIKCN